MNATGLLLSLSLGVILMGPTSCAPGIEELDSPSILKDAGGLAAFAYSRKKQPQTEHKLNPTMPPTKNLSHYQRMAWSDNCEPLGKPCKFPEQCCTRVCLSVTRRCAIGGS